MTKLTLAALLFATASSMGAAVLDYNLNFSLTGAGGAQFFVDGSFNADPTLATVHAADGLGETYAVAPTGLAVTVFDLGGTTLPKGDLTYSSANVQNAGLVYFKSYNPADGSADPIWTLSEQIPSLAGEYLTLVMNGSTDSIYTSSTLGGTTTLVVSGQATFAAATDLPPTVPEPATLGLLAAAGLGLFGLRKRVASRR